MRQNERRGCLNSEVRRMAERAVGMGWLAVQVRVCHLRQAGKDDEGTTEEAKRDP
jgi:hypothetical protein